ncbi:SIS domain-containing protein [Teredinibacter sp. KSP-S5-2]|nr:SIS domain-containing protein [Teredinibacter sp. KSP-S5-2]WNO08526.1 SIS domain-containing protein [Teredinibacter sp. KSP-S5-2]
MDKSRFLIMSQRVYTLFQKSVEAKMQVGEELAPRITNASNLLVESLLSENKILVCGNGASAALAQIFTSSLLDRYEKERPGLPAIWLGSNIATYTSISADVSRADVYAKPLKALGQPGDCLVVISSSGNSLNLVQAITAAQDRGIRVIALTGRDGGSISAMLSESDIEICASVDSRGRIHEIHLLTLFCLCDLIDNQLFGIE